MHLKNRTGHDRRAKLDAYDYSFRFTPGFLYFLSCRYYCEHFSLTLLIRFLPRFTTLLGLATLSRGSSAKIASLRFFLRMLVLLLIEIKLSRMYTVDRKLYTRQRTEIQFLSWLLNCGFLCKLMFLEKPKRMELRQFVSASK